MLDEDRTKRLFQTVEEYRGLLRDIGTRVSTGGPLKSSDLIQLAQARGVSLSSFMNPRGAWWMWTESQVYEAYLNDEITEGMACELLAIDRLSFRDRVNPLRNAQEAQEEETTDG